MLIATQISKRYETPRSAVPILDEVSLTVSPGDTSRSRLRTMVRVPCASRASILRPSTESEGGAALTGHARGRRVVLKASRPRC